MSFLRSKYNIYVKDGKDLLIYNSLKGLQSLCKINKTTHKELYDCIDRNDNIGINKCYDELLEKRILYDETFDEDSYRKLITNQSLYNSGVNLIILPTEKCNFRCTYCYETFEKPRMSEKTIKNLKGFLSRHIHSFQKLNLDWFGGEPLCAYEIIEDIMKFCKALTKKTGVPVVSTMTTNGYLLTPDVIRTLISLNVVGYQVTIDGIEQIHNSQRQLKNGEGTFKTIVTNLNGIKREIRSGVLNICIRVNLSERSIKCCPDFFLFLKEHFEDDERFSLSLRYVRDLKGNGLTDNIIDDDSVMLEVYHMAAQFIPRLLSSHFLNMLNSTGGCYAGKPNSFVVGADGTIYKCTVHFKEEINIIGKLENNDLSINEDKASIWVYSRSNNECNNCWYRGGCYDGSCPYSALINPNKKSCPFEKTHINYILRFLNSNRIIKEIHT